MQKWWFRYLVNLLLFSCSTIGPLVTKKVNKTMLIDTKKETFDEMAKAENAARRELEALFQQYKLRTNLCLELCSHFYKTLDHTVYESNGGIRNWPTRKFKNKFSSVREALAYFKNGLSEVEGGYEDIFSLLPYIDDDQDGERMLIHIMYVPPKLRGKGVGKALFKQYLASLPATVKYVRLVSCSLGSGDTVNFWKSLGFTNAYLSNDDYTSRILHLAVNGHSLPPTEAVPDGEERHYIFD